MSLLVYIVYKVYTRSGIGRIRTHFLGDIIFRAVTLGHHPPMTGLYSRFFLVLVFFIFVVVVVVIIKEQTQQTKRGERERQVETNQ